ncbi:MAG: phosphopantothenoylcysteine decarboxylase [Candidatus Omnitrophica bacterium]|nr:phosphopantothenoylcysteine decarboxylase [Candidatus Omnitrophota bacterium]
MKKILITAGPTRELLDPVRFLSNLSTGEMGYALAKTARKMKHQVTLISGPVALEAPAGVKLVRVTSAAEMKKACQRYFPSHDVLIMTAAVCDFTAASKHRHKIHRTHTKQLLLKQTPDIVAGLAKKKGKRVVIGFCLETEDWLKRAQEKLQRKQLNGIVANYYKPGFYVPFGKQKITTAFIRPDALPLRLTQRSKPEISRRLLEWIKDLEKLQLQDKK